MSLGHHVKLSRRTFLKGTLGAAALATGTPHVLIAADHTLPLGDARFTQKFQGASLNVLMIDLTLSFEIQKRLPEFEAMTGISVNIEISPYDAYHPKAMLPLASGADTYDVMMVDVPWVAEFVGTNNLLPLDDFVAKEDPFYYSDMVPELINVMNGSLDKLYSLATLPTTQLLSYRKDVFEKEAANFQAATGQELKVPTTWREYADIAKHFTKRLNPDSPTEFGVTMTGTPGNGALNMFQPVLWGMGAREFDNDFNVTINDEKALAAWNLFAELGQAAEDGVGSVYWDDMNKVYQFGQAAMMFMYHVFVVGNEQDDSPVQGKSGYATIPGGTPVIGGWSTSINKNTASPEAAWEFLRWITGPEVAKDLFVAGGATARTSVLTDPDMVSQYPFLPALLDSYKLVQNRASACAACPPIIPEAQYEIQTGAEASAVLSGAKTPQRAADDAAHALEQLLKDFGYRQ
ncbi:MAG: substrate-binding domain-containing protein [Candidatus Tectomicrobia bacterium]|nr:substrate-binding domain-containing protein [Candidatus Tectomicrobia bacterium]